MEDKDNSGLIIGLIIGTIITLALLSRNTQILPMQPVQQTQQQPQQQTLYNWQPMDIPRVDDIKPQPQHQPQIIQPPVIQVQQDPKLTEMVSQLQKTNSQLEQATSKLEELQETVSKLRQDRQDSTYQVPHVIVQPEHQPQIIIQQLPEPQPQHQPESQPIITVPQQTIQSTIQHIDQPIPISQPVEQIYKNSEKWKIVRGQNGRIKSLDIIRDVKKTS
jgi:hypothetical protein